MTVLVGAVLEPGRVAALAETAPVVAVVRERAVRVQAVAPAPVVVQDLGLVAARAATAPGVRVAGAAVRIRALLIPPSRWLVVGGQWSVVEPRRLRASTTDHRPPTSYRPASR